MIDGCRRGGKATSARKARAARENSKLGGRKRKDGLPVGWKKKGMSEAEADLAYRKGTHQKVADDKRALMSRHGWPLEKEWEWEQENGGEDSETLEAAETETETHIEEVCGAGDRSLYVEWRDRSMKELRWEMSRFPPDSLLRALCRYRLAETGAAETGAAETGAAVGGFEI